MLASCLRNSLTFTAPVHWVERIKTLPDINTYYIQFFIYKRDLACRLTIKEIERRILFRHESIANAELQRTDIVMHLWV